MTDRPTFADSDRPVAHDAVDFTAIEESPLSLAVFDKSSEALLQLNASASAIWLLCDGETTISEMTAQLVAAFGIEHHVAEESIDTALDSFVAAGLLEGSRTPEERVASTPGVRVLPREPDP